MKKPRRGSPRNVQKPAPIQHAFVKPKPTTGLRHKVSAVVATKTASHQPTKAEVQAASRKLRAGAIRLKRSKKRAALAAKRSKQGRPTNVKTARAEDLLEIYNSRLAEYAKMKADYMVVRSKYQTTR